MADFARLFVVALVALPTSGGGSARAADIELFARDGCPHCADAEVFLEALVRERPGLEVRVLRVDRDPAAASRMRDLSTAAGIRVHGLPTIIVGGRVLVGFDSDATTGRTIRALLDGAGTTTEDAPPACGVEADATGPCGPSPPAEPTRVRSDAVETGLGRLSVSELGLPLFTFLVGLVDGFNPCAMWVLLFLLAMLVNMKDRRRMTLIAGTFVLASGVVYFVFMAAWLNVFMLIGLSRGVQIGLGVLGLVVAAINIKDFFAFKVGVSLTIPDSAKPGIYARTRAILRQRTVAASLVGVIVLALAVNVIELLCTAGLPAMYTAILADQDLPTGAHYAYLGLYDVAYMLDDTIMVAIAIVTLDKTRLTERGGRWLKLVSGVVMLALGVVLIFFPGVLT